MCMLWIVCPCSGEAPGARIGSRLTVWLPFLGQDLDVHGGVDGAEDFSPLVPRVLVAGVNGARLPVRPVQRLVRQRQGKGMGQGALHHRLPVGQNSQHSTTN